MRPFSDAFFARRPAASMTEGFEVFVQLVIAAMTTLPFPIEVVTPLALTTSDDWLSSSDGSLPKPFSVFGLVKVSPNAVAISGN